MLSDQETHQAYSRVQMGLEYEELILDLKQQDISHMACDRCQYSVLTLTEYQTMTAVHQM